MVSNFQLMHQIMLRRVPTKKKMELWFKVNGFLARFSLAEFRVITGLPCEANDCKPPKHVSSLEFFGEKKCSHNELVQCFESESKSSEKKLIMAKLLIIEKVLLFRRSEFVSEENLSLACAENEFEIYPWGRDSYTKLVMSLKNIDLAYRQHGRRCYDIYGYNLAFQSWILEAFPSIAAKFLCNFKMIVGDPYSLHWECKAKHIYDSASALFDVELAPFFPIYGEFARTPGMVYSEEVADERFDDIAQPVFPKLDGVLYESYRLRTNAYNDRFTRNDALAVVVVNDTVNLVNKEDVVNDYALDAVGGNDGVNSEVKLDVVHKGKKMTSLRRGRSAGTFHSSPLLALEDKKSNKREATNMRKKKDSGKKVRLLDTKTDVLVKEHVIPVVAGDKAEPVIEWQKLEPAKIVYHRVKKRKTGDKESRNVFYSECAEKSVSLQVASTADMLAPDGLSNQKGDVFCSDRDTGGVRDDAVDSGTGGALDDDFGGAYSADSTGSTVSPIGSPHTHVNSSGPEIQDIPLGVDPGTKTPGVCVDDPIDASIPEADIYCYVPGNGCGVGLSSPKKGENRDEKGDVPFRFDANAPPAPVIDSSSQVVQEIFKRLDKLEQLPDCLNEVAASVGEKLDGITKMLYVIVEKFTSLENKVTTHACTVDVSQPVHSIPNNDAGTTSNDEVFSDILADLPVAPVIVPDFNRGDEAGIPNVDLNLPSNEMSSEFGVIPEADIEGKRRIDVDDLNDVHPEVDGKNSDLKELKVVLGDAGLMDVDVIPTEGDFGWSHCTNSDPQWLQVACPAAEYDGVRFDTNPSLHASDALCPPSTIVDVKLVPFSINFAGDVEKTNCDISLLGVGVGDANSVPSADIHTDADISFGEAGDLNEADKEDVAVNNVKVVVEDVGGMDVDRMQLKGGFIDAHRHQGDAQNDSQNEDSDVNELKRVSEDAGGMNVDVKPNEGGLIDSHRPQGDAQNEPQHEESDVKETKGGIDDACGTPVDVRSIESGIIDSQRPQGNAKCLTIVCVDTQMSSDVNVLPEADIHSKCSAEVVELNATESEFDVKIPDVKDRTEYIETEHEMGGSDMQDSINVCTECDEKDDDITLMGFESVNSKLQSDDSNALRPPCKVVALGMDPPSKNVEVDVENVDDMGSDAVYSHPKESTSAVDVHNLMGGDVNAVCPDVKCSVNACDMSFSPSIAISEVLLSLKDVFEGGLCDVKDTVGGEADGVGKPSYIFSTEAGDASVKGSASSIPCVSNSLVIVPENYVPTRSVDWDSYAKDPTILTEIEKLKQANSIPMDSSLLFSPRVQETEKKLAQYNAKKSLISREDHKFMYSIMKSKRDFSVCTTSGRVGKSFFHNILSRGKWLDSENLEAAFYYIRKRISEEADKYKDCVVVDWLFAVKYWPSCASDYVEDDDVDKSIEAYFTGDCPDTYPKAWAAAKKIYTPFNIHNLHWVALEILIDEKVINVYDCNVTGIAPGLLDQYLQPITKWLPIHLVKAGVYENFTSSPFKLIKVSGLLHDRSSAACGVFVVKAIQALIFGGDVKAITNEDLFRYRELMCVDLIKERWSFIM